MEVTGKFSQQRKFYVHYHGFRFADNCKSPKWEINVFIKHKIPFPVSLLRSEVKNISPCSTINYFLCSEL